MEELVVKVTELNPPLEKEIRDLLADMGKSSAGFEECELFARMDQAGHVLGVACTLEGEGYCQLLFVAVRRDARRRGTGSMIVNHVLSHYAGACDAMYLFTEDEGFFERFGFERAPEDRLPEDVRRRVGYSGATKQVTAMQIELPGHWTRK
jgi:N-acetylglutamate synthase-like GNAT family acetyltransferase